MTKFISQSIVFGFILSQSRVGNQKVLLSLFLNINKVLRLRLCIIKFVSHILSSLDLLSVSQEKRETVADIYKTQHTLSI
jgi:hypothetical protein